MIIAGLFTFLFPLVHLAVSWSLEDNPIHQFEFFEWLIRPLLTALFALPVYYLFRWADHFTHKDLPKEVMGTEYL